MAKRKQTTQRVVLVEPETPENEPEIPVDVDELRAIAELEGNSDVKWRVERTTNPMGFCGTLSSAEVSFERIQELWGKGTYRVRGTRANGQFVAQRTFVVVEESQTAVKAATPAPAAAGPATTSTQDLILLLESRESASALSAAAEMGRDFLTPAVRARDRQHVRRWQGPIKLTLT